MIDGRLGEDPSANVALVRAALVAAADAMPDVGETCLPAAHTARPRDRCRHRARPALRPRGRDARLPWNATVAGSGRPRRRGGRRGGAARRSFGHGIRSTRSSQHPGGSWRGASPGSPSLHRASGHDRISWLTRCRRRAGGARCRGAAALSDAARGHRRRSGAAAAGALQRHAAWLARRWSKRQLPASSSTTSSPATP